MGLCFDLNFKGSLRLSVLEDSANTGAVILVTEANAELLDVPFLRDVSEDRVRFSPSEK